MREPLEIIADIRNYISTTNPFRFYNLETPVLDYLTELENILTPVTEEPIIEEPIVEEVIEEVAVEEPITEEPVVEEVVVKTPKRNARKK